MKDNLFTFHKSIHGYRHIQEGIPCQDSSISLAESAGKYQIVAIADGHGDPACHRSASGSKFAVEVACKCLADFADAILSEDLIFSYRRQQAESIQQLTNTILSKWNGAVRNDLLVNRITEEDLKDSGQYEERYRCGERLEHLYGTTLIAALHVSHFLILIQQGDGRCDVFYDDGSVDQPIPWDERCEGATTTSMCDKDAFNRIRSKVIDTDEKIVVACYVGSDGVEDSYYENEENQSGTHRFYMDLTCKIHEKGADIFDKYLDEMLPIFSQNGSADDVSVAGIVDLNETINLVDDYASKVKMYDQKETLRKKLVDANSKVISMDRKHGALAEKVKHLEKTLDEKSELHESVTEQIVKLKKLHEELTDKVEQEKASLEGYQKDSKLVTERLKGKFPHLTAPIHHFLSDIANDISTKEITHKKLIEQLQKCDAAILSAKENESLLNAEITELLTNLEQSKKEFEEYDLQFSKYKELAQKTEEEILRLTEIENSFNCTKSDLADEDLD